MSNLHLGLDSSTQSLSGTLIDIDAGKVVWSDSVNFGKAFPGYGTTDGVLRQADPTVIHAPPLMWLDALDLLLEQMREAGADTGAIRSVSGSGQQHGTVYLNEEAEKALAGLDPSRPLADNLRHTLSRATSPIWMDSSTSRQCREISEAMEKSGGIIEATGSAAIERFSGPQIRKFWQEQPVDYERTRHVALVSSFLCSVLSGKIAPIDPGDGAGMNLMDIRRRNWHAAALDATAPGLAGRLPPLAASGTVIGPVSPYFVKRYGFSPEARSVIWSGDNPCSVVGLGLVQPGMVAISMGTSYTYFGTMAECHVDPSGEGHVFGSPAGGYMTLNCFKNGGLARARIRDQFGLDWPGYRKAMASVPAGNQGRLMLPWFDTEIVPRVLKPGVHRKGLDVQDAPGNCRALVEAQMLAMRLHAQWMQTKPTRIYATGGASEDQGVLQIMADIFQCPVQRSEVSNGAALGAALIAAHAAEGGRKNWPDLVRSFTAGAEAPVQPDPDAAAVYDPLLADYKAFEKQALEEIGAGS